jgi:hypothetical protein
LALGRGDLRNGLDSALFGLCYGDGRDVPEELRPTYEAILEELRRRAGIGIDFWRLRVWLGRCNLTTAERIAREIMKMDRRLTAREAQLGMSHSPFQRTRTAE